MLLNNLIIDLLVKKFFNLQVLGQNSLESILEKNIYKITLFNHN
jgi:hypothetical protein